MKALIKDVLYSHHSGEIGRIKTSAQECLQQPRYLQGCDEMINYHLKQMKFVGQDLLELQKDFSQMLRPFSKALRDWPTIWCYFEKKHGLNGK